VSDDRIRLAEAMGWTRIGRQRFTHNGQQFLVGAPPNGSGQGRSKLPDPFHDANDDYAVLEWMRTRDCHGNEWDVSEFTHHLGYAHRIDYQIGDYARATLKVIES